MASFFPEFKFFNFWLKTMDYNKALLPKLMSFFVIFVLLTGRCYEAKICVILLPLRCSFWWYTFLPESKFSTSGQNVFRTILISKLLDVRLL